MRHLRYRLIRFEHAILPRHPLNRRLSRALLLAACVGLLTARVARAQNAIVGENALPGNPPSEWDGGGDGGSAFGGAIYNTGTLTVAHTTFRSNFAGGQPSGFGRSTGWGGNGGAPGSDGEAGAFSVGVGFNCYAAGATCG